MSCVFCCRTKASSKNLGISFHSFPKDNEIRKEWVEACVSRGCELDEDMKSTKLCSVHFTLNDYEANKQVRTFLKKRVVPSCFWRKPYMHCIVCSDVGSANWDVYLYEFPEDSIVRKQWISACRENGFNIQNVSQQHRICSKHFSAHCYTAIDDGSKYLELNAVPDIFSSPTIAASSVQPNENVIASTEFVDINSCSEMPLDDLTANSSTSPAVRESIESELADEPVSSASPEPTTKLKVWRPARVGDFREEHFSTPRSAKRNFHVLFGLCKEYQSKIAVYRAKTWRLQKKIKNLENLLSHLTDK